MYLNQITIMGYVGKDPRTKKLDNGKTVCNFSLCVTPPFGDKKPEWFQVIAWDKKADEISKFLAQGKPLYVSGRIGTRDFEKRDGTKERMVEITAENIQLLSSKQEDQKERQREVPVEAEGDEPFEVPF